MSASYYLFVLLFGYSCTAVPQGEVTVCNEAPSGEFRMWLQHTETWDDATRGSDEWVSVTLRTLYFGCETYTYDRTEAKAGTIDDTGHDMLSWDYIELSVMDYESRTDDDYPWTTLMGLACPAPGHTSTFYIFDPGTGVDASCSDPGILPSSDLRRP